jgi:maleylacetoacetate isomerase/maleylpyruvate isomerase
MQGRTMKFFSFWRSLASFRVRIALNMKGIVPDEVVSVDLMKGQQRADDYRTVNPQMLIPTLIDGDKTLSESLAIIEYLDEVHPAPPLLPADAYGRARVRSLAQMVACDSHPLIVPRVREFLADAFKLDEAARMHWCRHWITEALTALEARLARERETGRYCHGDAPGLADICLASQAVGAKFFQVDLAPFPTVARIVEQCLTLDAFARAHPLKQPGAPATV